MEHKFIQLLEKYLSNGTTEAEEDEFFELIHAGTNELLVKQRIDTILREDTGTGDDLSVERANQILQYILNVDKKPSAHVAERRLGTNPWVWAAAASLFIAVAVVWLISRQTDSPKNELARTPSTLQAKPGPMVVKGKQYIHLPDGSKVLLNDNSELSYGANFGDNVRDVQLKGEAYFDIAHNPSKPFRVISGTVITKVLGTAFNVQAYDENVKVTVTRGKVEVFNDKKSLAVITNEQQVMVNTRTNQVRQEENQADAATAWKSNYLIFDNVSMETAAAIIEEKYAIKIIFANDDLKRCRITATFLNDEDIHQVIDVMSGVIQAAASAQPDGNIRIDGRGCQ